MAGAHRACREMPTPSFTAAPRTSPQTLLYKCRITSNDMGKSGHPYTDIPRSAIRAAIAEILLEGGRPIPAIEKAHGKRFPGDGRYARHRDRPVWHRKRDMDTAVAERLGLDVDALLGPRRRSSDFSIYTGMVIFDLRRNGLINDWNLGERLGIFMAGNAAKLSECGVRWAKAAERSASTSTAGSAAPNLNSTFLTILERGRKDNTYKFALARALLDYCGDHADASADRLEIPYSYFADKFMRYYFHQEYKFRIRQNFHVDKPPSAIKALREVFGEAAPGDLDLLDKGEVDRARNLFLKRIFGHARRKTSQVIPRFQRVMAGSHTTLAPVFYDYDDDAQVLTLKPAAFGFLKANRAVLSKAVLAEWAKYLERANPSLPMLVAKIERDEAKRGPLTRYRRMYLEHWCHCFYCMDRLERSYVHVDHLIPWSYLFDDNAWNLVLACRDCNCKKSSSLPQGEFRDALIDRNEKYYAILPGLQRSLDLLDTGRGWDAEIVEQYKRCAEYGFGITTMP